MKSVTIEEAQSNLAAVLSAARGERIVVEQEGRPVGVILSLDDAAWDEPLEAVARTLFARPEVQAQIARADAARAAGEVISHDEVRARLRERRDG